MQSLFLLARRVVLAAIGTAALTTACSNLPGSTYGSDPSVSGAGADRECQVFRSYRDRPYVELMEACRRHLSEEACHRCID